MHNNFRRTSAILTCIRYVDRLYLNIFFEGDMLGAMRLLDDIYRNITLEVADRFLIDNVFGIAVVFDTWAGDIRAGLQVHVAG